MKKILSLVLAVCMIFSLFTVSTSAASSLSTFRAKVGEPTVGKPLSYEAKLYGISSAEVAGVEWAGNLDANGNVKAGEKYTVYITIRLVEGADKYIAKQAQANLLVNDKYADLINISEDKRQAVLTYTFDLGYVDPFEGMKEVNYFKLDVQRPMEGEPLSYVVSISEKQAEYIDVVEIVWEGNVDENGNAIRREPYTAKIRVRIKEAYRSKYYIKQRVNFNEKFDYISPDGMEAVVIYSAPTLDKPEVKEEDKYVITEKVTTDIVPAEIKQTPFAFAGGSGTAEDPYLIQTAEQLNSIRFGADKHYKLIADIDLSSWGNWVPIGGTCAYGAAYGSTNKAQQGSVQFTGSFDGNGHVVSGMTIKVHDKALYLPDGVNDRYYGLFGVINAEGVAVKNLGIINYNIDLKYETVPNALTFNVGSLAAMTMKANIENCYSAGGKINVDLGKVIMKNSYDGDHRMVFVGGLVGTQLGNMTRCYNTSEINIDYLKPCSIAYAGGLAGTVLHAQIRECYNKGNITVKQYLDPDDGMANWSASCASGIAVKGEMDGIPSVKGLPPTSTNAFYDCYNTGNLTANGVSGIVYYSGWDIYVYRSYNAGNLNAHTVGHVPYPIINKYSSIYTDANPATYIVGCATEGGTSVSGDAWQYSSALGRPVLKWNPTETVPQKTANTDKAVGNFWDVKTSDWFADPVKWAVEKSVTAGTSASTFSPDNTCTRAQILTFLWRAVGSPKANISNPFTDVKASDYYFDAALWAYEKGIVSTNTLSANTPCKRGETVIYLYKSAGSPESDQINQFYDVPASDVSLNRAVCWAFVNNITGGTSYNYFSPNETCTRGQIVTFLYRAFK